MEKHIVLNLIALVLVVSGFISFFWDKLISSILVIAGALLHLLSKKIMSS
ncbi:MAG: hypothetical protein J7K73_03390 [Nanoarchaeota archaeon]|nr:hypothetical protein [Nanoarchaeota archaeon]